MVLATPRLTLRPLVAEDRAAFIGVHEASRASLSRFLPLGPEEAESGAIFDRQLEMTLEGESTGRAMRRIGVDGSGAIIGAFNLTVIRRGLESSADVAAWLAEGRTGRGYAYEGLAALIGFAFDDPPLGHGVLELDGWVQPGNTSSHALALRLGFERRAGETEHMRIGDRWALHERWTQPAERWRARVGA